MKRLSEELQVLLTFGQYSSIIKNSKLFYLYWNITAIADYFRMSDSINSSQLAIDISVAAVPKPSTSRDFAALL